MKSTKEEVIELLLNPLHGIFGEFSNGQAKWLIEYCTAYSPEQLSQAADHIIRDCERKPYPATIVKALNPKGEVKSNVGTF